MTQNQAILEYIKDLEKQNFRERKKKLILDSPDASQIRIDRNKIPSSDQLQKLYISEPKKRIRLKQQLQEECPVCMMNFEELKKVCEIETCKHQICFDCLKEWAENYKRQCPFCRAKFKKAYAVQDGRRANTPIDFNLKKPKWQFENDQFYNDEQNEQCQICKGSYCRNYMLICDKCDEQFCHTFCDPALLSVQIPTSNWYCLDCRKNRLTYSKPKVQ